MQTVESTKSLAAVPEFLWGFFASVRTAIILIALIALSSVLGTLIPQENTISSTNPAVYYPTTYGNFGIVMFALGLTHMYTSTWFIALLIALALNLIICSWERLVPLYHSLNRQQVTVKPFLLKHRGLYTSISDLPGEFDLVKEGVIASFTRRRYRVRQEGTAFFAEKGRFARYGPYVIHIGLLVIIAGCLTRLIPGFYYTGNILVDEGQTVNVPSSDFQIRNDHAHEEQYDDGRPKFYETQTTVIQNGKEMMHASITVNHPLKYHGMILFQAVMMPLQYRTMDVTLVDQQRNNEKVGSFKLDFADPKKTYQVGAYTITLLNYYPDFAGLNAKQEPSSKSSTPYAPAFIVRLAGPGITGDQKQWFVPSAPFLRAALAKNNRFDLVPTQVGLAQTTGLRVQKDFGIPIVYAGCLLVVLGLVQTFYFQHRRIWGNFSEGVLHLGGQTNKNWYAFKRELERVLAANSWNAELTRSQGGKN